MAGNTISQFKTHSINCCILFLQLILFSATTTGQEAFDSEWATEFETSGYTSSPNYDATMEYFERLAAFSEYAEIFSFGNSPQNRDLNCIIVSKDKIFDPFEIRKRNKPVVLFLSGIHSGEINGKDASMLLLREILVTKEKIDLIENTILLVIPIFSVDGHERRGPYNRINQIGPEEMGWRVTAQNYNLNRDFMKADAPEMKSFLKLYSTWLPDFFVDIHSTDGADHQYQTTITIERHKNTRPVISKWVNSEFYPYIYQSVQEKGYTISPFVGFVEGDPKKGIRDWVATPRFSNGYAAIQNRPGLLIESHVLKTYKERVYSTLAVLESTLELISKDPDKIVEMNKQADSEGIEKYAGGAESYPLKFTRLKANETYNFKGIEFEMKYSELAGGEVKVFTGKKFEQEVPYLTDFEITKSVKLPEAYLVPEEWNQLAEIMKLHGIEITKLKEDARYIVERIKFSNVSFAAAPYESRFIPSYEMISIIDTVDVRKGSYLIETNQRTFGVIAYLLEPESGESFVKWGAMNQIFERKEYFENYAMLPIAEEMYENDPVLREEFNRKVNSDSEFKNSIRARLNFFYERSPYYDSNHNWYPVLKMLKKIEK
jgi:hypothetical protein